MKAMLVGKILDRTEVVGYVFYDRKSKSLMPVDLIKTIQVVANGFCENAIISGEELIRTDGGKDNLMEFSLQGQRIDNKVAVLKTISQPNGNIIGCVLLNGKGIEAKVGIAQAIEAIDRCGAINAKVVRRGNSVNLSAIKGELNTESVNIISPVQDTSKFGRHSASIVMLARLVYGDKGAAYINVPIARTVGYSFKNVGNERIEYSTKVYSFDENRRKWAGVDSRKILNPGQVTCLSVSDTKLWLNTPEFKGRVRNGWIPYPPNKTALKLNSLKFILESEIDSIQIAQQDQDGKWGVMPNLLSVFGYLENRFL